MEKRDKVKKVIKKDKERRRNGAKKKKEAIKREKEVREIGEIKKRR